VIEGDFQAQLVGPKGLATMLGFVHVHFRPARTNHGWRTPGSGEMAEGWPDLTLLHLATGRLMFVELKGDGSDGKKRGKTTAAQDMVLGWLRLTGHEVYVWWPKDIESIDNVLRSAPSPTGIGTSANGSGTSGGGPEKPVGSVIG